MLAAAGSVYIAPPDYHLLLERDGSLALSIDEPLHYQDGQKNVTAGVAATGPRSMQ